MAWVAVDKDGIEKISIIKNLTDLFPEVYGTVIIL